MPTNKTGMPGICFIKGKLDINDEYVTCDARNAYGWNFD